MEILHSPHVQKHDSKLMLAAEVEQPALQTCFTSSGKSAKVPVEGMQRPSAITQEGREPSMELHHSYWSAYSRGVLVVDVQEQPID